jgi:integrase
MPKFTLRTPNSRRSIPSGTKLHIDPLPAPGLAIGYRKSESVGGVWFARKHREGTTKYIFQRIGLADDTQPANGTTVFSYEQTVKEAEKWEAHQTGQVLINKAYTVRNLMDDYLAYQELKKRRSQAKTKRRIEANILPTLGNVPLRKLTHHQVENWFHTLAKATPRLRPKRLDEPVYRKVADPADEEYLRQRQSSANRVWNIFRSMLNFGYKQNKVASRLAWDKVQEFGAVNEPRIVEISFDQLTAVIDSCDPVFQPMAKAALYTGARYGELCRMKVRDFNPKTSKVFLPKTKNSNSRYVFLHDEALEMFLELTTGRDPDEVIFLNNGNHWKRSNAQEPMHKAVDAAGVTRKFTFHQFRHQCACICLESGMTMEQVSQMLGHKSIAITQKYYARFSKDHMQEAVQRYAPRLRPVAPQNDPTDSDKVIPIQQVRRRA